MNEKDSLEMQELIREAMRALGKRKSPAKTMSCRENAKRSWTPEARENRKKQKKGKL